MIISFYMIINTQGNLLVHYFLCCKNLKGHLALLLCRNWQKYPLQICSSFVHLLYIRKEHQTIGEFDKIHESISYVESILVLDKWGGQTDKGICIEKFNQRKSHEAKGNQRNTKGNRTENKGNQTKPASQQHSYIYITIR